MIPFIQIVVGFMLLFAGSESLVRGSVSLALSYGISKLIIGLTLIAFATSSPELFVGIGAAMEGKNGLVLGNMLGSNICNICLIIGISSVLRPIQISAETIRREAPLLVAVTLLICVVCTGGVINRFEGGLLLGAFIIYNVFLIRSARNSQGQGADYMDDPIFKQQRKSATSFLLVFLGVVLLIVGAEILIRGATDAARQFNISEAIIGLTLLAIGTSLPELAAALNASLKGESDLIVGNVIGSNLFNVLCVLGLVALLSPIATDSMTRLDFSIFAVSGIILLPLMKTGSRIDRWEGITLLAIYGGYLTFLVQS